MAHPDEVYREQAQNILFMLERTPPPQIQTGRAVLYIPPKRVAVRCDKFPEEAVPAMVVAEAELPTLVLEGAEQHVEDAWYVKCPAGCAAGEECDECPDDRGAVKARVRVDEEECGEEAGSSPSTRVKDLLCGLRLGRTLDGDSRERSAIDEEECGEESPDAETTEEASAGPELSDDWPIQKIANWFDEQGARKMLAEAAEEYRPVRWIGVNPTKTPDTILQVVAETDLKISGVPVYVAPWQAECDPVVTLFNVPRPGGEDIPQLVDAPETDRPLLVWRFDALAESTIIEHRFQELARLADRRGWDLQAVGSETEDLVLEGRSLLGEDAEDCAGDLTQAFRRAGHYLENGLGGLTSDEGDTEPAPPDEPDCSVQPCDGAVTQHVDGKPYCNAHSPGEGAEDGDTDE